MAEVLQRHADQFPALTAAIAAIAAGVFTPRHDDPLDFGLDRILDGISALLDPARG